MASKPATKSKSLPTPVRNNERYSVSTERISNGFLIHESHTSGDKWTDKTTFSATKPKISAPVIGAPSKKGKR